jgi:hypothetical protein
MSTEKKQITVRELAGEIWAEINGAHWGRAQQLDPAELNQFIDTTLGVLARHDGHIIVNDTDLPVQPLPKPDEL